MRLLDSARAATGTRVPPSIRLDDLLAATGGHLLAPTTVSSFSTAAVDSRQVIPGCCFVALRGERVDGHHYVADAVRAGASVVLIERPVEVPPGHEVAQVSVADALFALQEAAAWWRSQLPVRVVGVTGSTGKTIAKEMVADVLSRTLRTLRNEGNLNSETGLPMSLLRCDPSHEVAVLEMSMYTEGEIARLAEISRPEVGVVLSVHPTHLMRAGSIEAIARAKSELPAALPASGLAVLNADDPRVAAMREVTAAAGAHLRHRRERRPARRGGAARRAPPVRSSRWSRHGGPAASAARRPAATWCHTPWPRLRSASGWASPSQRSRRALRPGAAHRTAWRSRRASRGRP